MAVPTKVDELRSSLLDMGMSEEEVIKLSKGELKIVYEQKVRAVETSSFDIEFTESEEEATIADALPEYGSPEWQEYVISLMEPSETLDGYPKCHGLRRVAQLLLGPIVKSGPSMLSVIPTNEGRATTIVYEVTFDWTLNRPIWFNPNAPSTASYRIFGGCADCIEDIKSPYGRHPAASAETKAASRAFKKALCINVLSAEERISGYDEKGEESAPDNSKITTQLCNFISAKINVLKLDLDTVSKEFGLSNKLEKIPMSEGRLFFAFVNNYQQGK